MCGNDLVNPGTFYGVEAAPPSYTDGNFGLCALNTNLSSFNKQYTASGMMPTNDACRHLYLEKAINQDDLGVRAMPSINFILSCLWM